MERKFIEELEIVDGKLTKESIDKVLNEHHKAVNLLKESEKNLKEQIETRDKDLAELKKVDANDLQKRLDDLQVNYDNLKSESEKTLKETTKKMLLDNALSKTKARDFDDIKKFIDFEKIAVDNDQLIGLSEQLSELEANKSYLFNVEEQKKDVDLGGDLETEVSTNDDAFINSIMGLK